MVIYMRRWQCHANKNFTDCETDETSLTKLFQRARDLKKRLYPSTVNIFIMITYAANEIF